MLPDPKQLRADETLGHGLDEGRAVVVRGTRRARKLFVTGLGLVVAGGVYGALATRQTPWVAFAIGSALFSGLACLVVALRAQERLQKLDTRLQWLSLIRAAVAEGDSKRIQLCSDKLVVEAPQQGASSPRLRHSDDARWRSGPAWVSAAAVGAIVMVLIVVASLGSASPAVMRWTFTEAEPSLLELGLRPLGSDAGGWSLEGHAAATGARALLNREGDVGAGPAILVADTLIARDARLLTRCKGERFEVADTHACGIAFRMKRGAPSAPGFADEAPRLQSGVDAPGDARAREYLVAYVDVTQKRVVVASFDRHGEKTLATAPVDLAPEGWHELVVELRGDRVSVGLHGRTVIETRDPSNLRGTAVGLWAPSRARIWFDEFVVESRPVMPSALELVPMAKSSS